jgi:hypothetical protein
MASHKRQNGRYRDHAGQDKKQNRRPTSGTIFGDRKLGYEREEHHNRRKQFDKAVSPKRQQRQAVGSAGCVERYSTFDKHPRCGNAL